MFKKIFQLINNTECKMVIIVRSDIKMSKGKMASQVAHAAVSLYHSALKSSNPHLKHWFNNGQPKIVLKADSYDEIMAIYKKAAKYNLNTCVIHDAGRTQLENGTLTTVGIGPNNKDDINKITNSLKLLQ